LTSAPLSENSIGPLEIRVPGEWHSALERITAGKGTAILLGATDTGKSTLAKFLISHLCRKGIKTALVDADIGQSFLGLPTTIGLSIFESSPDWQGPLSPELFFVGSTSPEGYFPLHIEGTKRMVDRAFSSGAEIIIVDTTGFVLGESGRELKRRKIDLLQPHFILALQRSEELEHILALYKDNPVCRIDRLPVSEQVRPRSREERRNYRARKFQEYFEASKVQELPLNGISLQGSVKDSNGFSIPFGLALGIKGLLGGLKDGDGNLLALSVIKEFREEERSLKIDTPLTRLEKARALHLCPLRLTSSYNATRFNVSGSSFSSRAANWVSRSLIRLTRLSFASCRTFSILSWPTTH
jgi:polynucleotide 5'-kinase involved in rRNA processing